MLILFCACCKALDFVILAVRLQRYTVSWLNINSSSIRSLQLSEHYILFCRKWRQGAYVHRRAGFSTLSLSVCSTLICVFQFNWETARTIMFSWLFMAAPLCSFFNNKHRSERRLPFGQRWWPCPRGGCPCWTAVSGPFLIRGLGVVLAGQEEGQWVWGGPLEAGLAVLWPGLQHPPSQEACPEALEPHLQESGPYHSAPQRTTTKR